MHDDVSDRLCFDVTGLRELRPCTVISLTCVDAL